MPHSKDKLRVTRAYLRLLNNELVKVYRVLGRNSHVLPYQKYGDRDIYPKYSTPQNFLKMMSGTYKRFKSSHWKRAISTDPDSLGYDNSREEITCRGCKGTLCLGRTGSTILFHPWFHHKLRCAHLQKLLKQEYAKSKGSREDTQEQGMSGSCEEENESEPEVAQRQTSETRNSHLEPPAGISGSDTGEEEDNGPSQAESSVQRDTHSVQGRSRRMRSDKRQTPASVDSQDEVLANSNVTPTRLSEKRPVVMYLYDCEVHMHQDQDH